MLVLHPVLANVDCDDCLQNVYDLDSRSPNYGQPQLFQKKKTRYPPGLHAPCDKCPKGKPHGRELSPRNKLAYKHYLCCKATGFFPEDSLVQEHAGLIHDLLNKIENGREEANNELLIRVLERLSHRG